MKIFLSFLCFILLCLSASAQDSLFVYLEIAAKNSPTVLQKYNEYQAALQKVPQVGSLPDPDLSLGIFLSPMELLSGKQVADIRLMQMFPWFGVLKNAKDEMSLMAKAKYESFRDAKFQVFYDVQQTRFELLQVQENIRVSEKNREILQTLERLSMVKFKTSQGGGGAAPSDPSSTSGGTSLGNSSGSSGMGGMGGNSSNNTSANNNNASSSMGGSSVGGSELANSYRIQIEMADLENNIALLHNQQTTLIARFNSYLNRPMTTPVTLPDTLQPDTLNVSLAAISDSMLANNPMLGMLAYEQKSFEARKRMVTRMGYPMVGVGINYTVINKSEMSTSTMNGKDMIMPMVTVTLPIYRKKYRAMQNEADWMKSASEQGYKATANSLQVSYYEALQNNQDAQRRLLLYNKQQKLTQKTLDIMVRSFSTSGSDLSEILRVRQQLLDYELKNIQAITDLNKAIAMLKRLGAYEDYNNLNPASKTDGKEHKP